MIGKRRLVYPVIAYRIIGSDAVTVYKAYAVPVLAFGYTRFRRPHGELLPVREASIESVRYAANRADDTVKFTDAACMKLIKVPRIFLPTVLKGCVQWAKENGVTLIDEEQMNIINDKRAKEKQR